MPLGELWWRFNVISSTVYLSLSLSNKALTGEDPEQQLLYAESLTSQLDRC